MSRSRAPVGLGPRLLLTQGLVIVTGAVTMALVAVMLAPGLFHEHLSRAQVPLDGDLRDHVNEAFLSATSTSLGVAVTAAVITALVASWFVTRRVVRPVHAMARAAERIAGGDYAARVDVNGAGEELDSLGHAFDQMAQELAATQRTRAEMLRDVAHELRTPLTSLRGYVDALSDGVLSVNPETLQTLHAELSRVERLVDDLATVSRAEERRLDLHLVPVAAGQLVESAVRVATRAFAVAGVELRSEIEADLPLVLVDVDRIQEVLANLLDNALRHTPAPGVVTVLGRRRRAVVELVVRDTGDGIAPEHLRRVFERFYRVDAGRSRQKGGSGIGLAIARALTDAHGGTIHAESQGPGRGSTFTVTLPAPARPGQATAAPSRR